MVTTRSPVAPRATRDQVSVAAAGGVCVATAFGDAEAAVAALAVPATMKAVVVAIVMAASATAGFRQLACWESWMDGRLGGKFGGRIASPP
jgi:hypothetical protein